jgi:tetratricopeptide (TPR) repeat protein
MLALRWQATALVKAGETDLLESVAERASLLLRGQATTDRLLSAALQLGVICLYGGAAAQGDALWEVAEVSSPPLDLRSGPVAAMANRWRALRAQHAQDLETSARLHKQAAEQLRASGDARTAAVESGLEGYVLVLLGANDEAALVLETALAECERLGLASGAAVARHNLGLALLGLGRSREALASENEAIAAYALGANRRMECLSRNYASRILLALGLVEEAVAEAERASRMLPCDHPYSWSAHAALADALLVRRGAGDLPHALSYAQAAHRALCSNPARFEEPAFVLGVHIDALEANGLVDEARQAREEARGWVLERASKIRSEHYRRTFLEGALDVARILKCPSGPGAA